MLSLLPSSVLRWPVPECCYTLGPCPGFSPLFSLSPFPGQSCPPTLCCHPASSADLQVHRCLPHSSIRTSLRGVTPQMQHIETTHGPSLSGCSCLRAFVWAVPSAGHALAAPTLTPYRQMPSMPQDSATEQRGSLPSLQLIRFQLRLTFANSDNASIHGRSQCGEEDCQEATGLRWSHQPSVICRMGTITSNSPASWS